MRCVRRCVTGIGSCSYGDWKSHSLLSASWRTKKVGDAILEFKGLRMGGCGAADEACSESKKPQNQECRCTRAGEDGWMSLSSRENKCSLTLPLRCAYAHSRLIACCSPALPRAVLFTQSTDSNANPSRRHPHRRT